MVHTWEGVNEKIEFFLNNLPVLPISFSVLPHFMKIHFILHSDYERK